MMARLVLGRQVQIFTSKQNARMFGLRTCWYHAPIL